MNQSLLIGGIVVAVLIVGGFIFAGSRSGEPAETAQVAEETTNSLNSNTNMQPENGEPEVAGDSDSAQLSVNTEQSTLTWKASKIASNFHEGTVDIQSGSVTKTPNGFSDGQFTIDMTSITDKDGSAKLEGHLKSDDFFNVEQFPTSTFKLTQGTNSSWTGDLTITDKTNEITFPVTISETAASTTVTAEFQIDRTQWEINFDSGTIFQQLGDKAIKDEINFSLQLVLDK